MSKIINLFDVKSKYQAINLIILMTLASVLELLGIGFVILVLNSFDCSISFGPGATRTEY